MFKNFSATTDDYTLTSMRILLGIVFFRTPHKKFWAGERYLSDTISGGP